MESLARRRLSRTANLRVARKNYRGEKLLTPQLCPAPANLLSPRHLAEKSPQRNPPVTPPYLAYGITDAHIRNSRTIFQSGCCRIMRTQSISGLFMKIRSLAVLAMFFVVFALAASAQTSVSVTYNLAPIDFPGSVVTNVNGINNANVIVGTYYDSHYCVHGFIYRQGKYTAVNFPGATLTQVLGINDNGDIVGTYQLSGKLNFHGFVRRGTEFTKINDPAAGFGTMAFGINNAGTIVGSYDNAHGFVYENGKFRTLDAPQRAGELPQTQLNGISNLGWIVGQVYTGGIWRGFWIQNGKFHFVEAAGSTDSQATGINGRGDVVGCHDSQAGFVSFLVGNLGTSAEPGKFPAEQKLVSCASAINYARVAVGSYSTMKNQFGFLAVPALMVQASQTRVDADSVHVNAAATGNNPISQMQVWVNGKEVYHVPGATMSTTVKMSSGTSQKLVVEAVDNKGLTAKVQNTVSN